ncbi:MAG: hypothetical protein AAF645_17075 [Myxococcota bacterium]
MKLRFLFLSLFALCTAGCWDDNVIVGTRDGGIDSGTACGTSTCGAGESCCQLGCDDDDFSCSPGGCPAIAPVCPTTCGDLECGEGSRCCEGCPGDEPFCSAEGISCPALDCAPPTCGTDTCGEGESCCQTGCDEDDFICSSGGCAAIGIECPGPVVCGGTTCEDSIACCGDCDGELSICSGPGGECPALACPPPACGDDICEDDGAVCCPACPGEAPFCSGPEGVCPAIACPECTPQDVRFEGGCEPANRYWFDGERCVGGTGCECIGRDCDAAFDRPEECEAAFAACIDPSCEADDAVAVGECDAIVGVAWNGRACVALSGCECEGTDCGRYTSEEQCVDEHAACGGGACEPTDAFGVGPCEAIVGVAWNGRDCVSLSGCSCGGTECDRYATRAECLADNAGCVGGECAPQEARGEGFCDLLLGVFFDGTACEFVSGCECIGADCRDGFESIEDCRERYDACF